jgi:hypothetical protein
MSLLKVRLPVSPASAETPGMFSHRILSTSFSDPLAFQPPVENDGYLYIDVATMAKAMEKVTDIVHGGLSSIVEKCINCSPPPQPAV